MSLWPAVGCFLAGFVVCYGLATLAAFTLPNDLPRNLLVVILVLLGGLLLVIFIGFVIAAVVRGVTV